VTLGLLLVSWQLRQSRLESEVDLASWKYVVIGLAYGFGLVGIVALRKGRWLRQVAYGQVAADAAIVTAVVFMTGGAESVFAFTYVFVVLEASMTLLRPGAILAFGLATLFFLVVLLLQATRFVPEVLRPVADSHVLFAFLVHTSGVGLVAVLAGGLANNLRIAGRRLAEREEDLERLEALQGAILRALPAGLLYVDASGVIRFGNEAANGILRRGAGELVGQPLSRVLPGVAEAQSASGSGEHGRRPAGLLRRRETTLVLPDGEPVRVGFSLAPLAEDASTSTIVVFQDLTEVARLEEAVGRAERLALVGKFAAGLAHEVRNPLASMCASIDVLEQTLDPPESMKRLMTNVVREASRLDHLIKDFLTLARPRKLTFARLELGALVEGVLGMFENDELARELSVEARVEKGVFANADPDLLRQVMWNLVRNAAEAMQGRGGGALSVDVREGRQGPVIEVADTGPGVDEERRRRVFDPFYTTKSEGSGLGLAICQSIVHAHGGEIELDSKPGQGTRVTVQLSRAVPTLDVTLDDYTPSPELIEAEEGGA
jgi:two-component system sensor histidine kinase PilS (NtrC family)